MSSLDQYYTAPAVATYCMNKLIDIISLNDYICIEPSSGTGSFYNLLPVPKIGIDLDPKHEGAIVQDFLTWYPENLSKLYITVGNPPFGKNSTLAVKFFNHAAIFSNFIAFIVPRTFQKNSIVNRLNSKFQLKFEEVLPLDSFIYQDKPYKVPTVFQVWQKNANLIRTITKKIVSHPDIIFCNNPANATIAFQRVGNNAGKISIEGLKLSANSHYFIKCDQSVINTLLKIDWSLIKYNTAGNPSISKSELIEEYCKLLK